MAATIYFSEALKEQQSDGFGIEVKVMPKFLNLEGEEIKPTTFSDVMAMLNRMDKVETLDMPGGES